MSKQYRPFVKGRGYGNYVDATPSGNNVSQTLGKLGYGATLTDVEREMQMMKGFQQCGGGRRVLKKRLSND